MNAATLIKRLEEEGIVSPWDGSKPRTILKQN
nr:DNA translocase FtsK [Bacillus velezensis]